MIHNLIHILGYQTHHKQHEYNSHVKAHKEQNKTGVEIQDEFGRTKIVPHGSHEHMTYLARVKAKRHTPELYSDDMKREDERKR